MGKTALMFAGQGAQVVGMGADFAAQFPEARALFDRANAVLGDDLATLCFNGPEAELTQTQHAQPAIFLTSWVALTLLRARCPQMHFDAVAGLSLGEFTALAAAGVMSFEDGLALVRLRGRLMQDACEATQGGMAAILGLDEGASREVCAQTGVELANLNCPGQLVISGEVDRIGVACEMAKERGAKRAVALPVAGAYHSRLMAPSQAGLDDALGRVALSLPSVPVISNVTAKAHGTCGEIRRRLVEQVTAPVRWEESMRGLLAQGFTRFIELGPGTTLCGFMRRIDKSAQVWNVADTASLAATVHALDEAAAAAANPLEQKEAS